MSKISIMKVMVSMSLFCACGGGGSGNASNFYGGVWEFQGRMLINDCNLNLPGAFSAVNTVNQDGTRVVLDSGSLVFEGKVNDHDDGFDVGIRRLADGCETASAYSYQEAEDGDASVGFAIVSACGSLACTVGYGGRSIRTSGRMLQSADDLPALLESLVLQTSTQSVYRQNVMAESSPLMPLLNDVMNKIHRFEE